MPADKPHSKAAARKQRLSEAVQALAALGFDPRQRNETAAYTLLAMLDLRPQAGRWELPQRIAPDCRGWGTKPQRGAPAPAQGRAQRRPGSTGNQYPKP